MSVSVLPRRAATPPRQAAIGHPRPLLILAVRLTGRGLARVVLRLQVTGRGHVPGHGPVLLAGNHTGNLDGPLVFFTSPRGPRLLAKSEMFTGIGARVWGWLGLIPVHRGTADRTALREGLAQLRSGGALAVFPEGSRGAGTFEEITDGLAYLALRSGAPVVPVAVHGTAAALPRGAVLPRLRASVRIVYGPAIRLEPVGDPRARSTVRAAAETLRQALIAHLSATASPDAPRSGAGQTTARAAP